MNNQYNIRVNYNDDLKTIFSIVIANDHQDLYEITKTTRLDGEYEYHTYDTYDIVRACYVKDTKHKPNKELIQVIEYITGFDQVPF